MRLLLLFALLVGVLPVQAKNRSQSAEQLYAVIQRAAAYHSAIITAATRHGIDPHLIWTIAYLETRFRPQLVSPKGARGMMQFIPATGRRYGLVTNRDLHNPLRSIEAAARYVRDLTTMFEGRTDLVLAGYNAGENAVLNRGYRVPPYRETRSYVARGLTILNRITQPSILALDRPEQLQIQVRRATCCTYRPAVRQQLIPTVRARTRSVYFPQ